jgi:hypothetical protein
MYDSLREEYLILKKLMDRRNTIMESIRVGDKIYRKSVWDLFEVEVVEIIDKQSGLIRVKYQEGYVREYYVDDLLTLEEYEDIKKYW